MPNTRETVRALVSAFNVHNYARNTVKTNFTLRSEGKKDYIVVSFDKSMDTYQCRRYLDSIKRKIVGEFYGIEEGDTDEVVLNTANLIFNIESFPFDTSRGKWSQDEQGRIEFLAPIDKGVIFNLKSHLASSLVKDVLEDMPTCSIVTNSFNKGKYLCHSKFPNKELRQQFEREFLSRMKERYENVPKNPLKVKGNDVYIRDVFDDARFIDSVTRYITWLIGMGLQDDSKNYSKVKAFKDLIIEFIDQSTRVVTSAFLCASPLNREESSILIPVILSNRGTRFLTKEEARDINHKFNNPVLDDISDKTQATFKVNGSSGIYGIDFSNKEISHCVITKIIESSVINKDHELAIDPELHFQALSPPGTPPNQRKAESGYDSNSPPKPKDSVAHSSSGDPGPSSKISHSQVSPPRQGSILRHDVGAAEVGAAANMPAWTSASFQPMDRWSLPVFYAQSSDISVPRFQPPTQLSSSGPSSWKGAAKNVQASTSARAQQTNPCLSQGTSENKWQPLQFTEPGFSGLSWKGANESTSIGNGTWCLPSSTSFLTTRNDSMSSSLGVFADSPSVKGKESIFSVEPEKQQVTDKSDRESSDECSEAKSQESESPKKYLDVLTSGIKSFFSSPSKPKQHDASLKRCDVGRDTMHSSVSAPGDFVTEKPPLSKRSASERRAKSSPPSKETSPVHSTISGSIPGLPSQGTTVVESNSGLKLQERLDPDQREELRPFLSPELQKKLGSNSLSPGKEQHLYLTHTLSGKCEITKSFESPEENLMRSINAQLPSSDNLSSKKVNRDSGFCSIGSASPAVPHKGSVSSELKHPQQVKHMSEALGK